MNTRQTLAVIIVTFNRRDDLKITLSQLALMQQEFDHLIVIDNCSTDSTTELLEQMMPQFSRNFQTIRLDENLGGAGGFHEGVKAAMNLPVDWIWLSDDDAIPQPGSLETLLRNAKDKNNIYGCVAIAKHSPHEDLCWPAVVLESDTRESPSIIGTRSELNPVEEVAMLPFLGLMVSKNKVLEVGLPNKHYFISGDDVEYCIRMQASGSKLIQIRDSVVIHPRIPRYIVRLLWRPVYCLRMPAWRRYFDTRNRIWNSRLRNGYLGAITTASILIPRMIFTLIYEQEVKGQVNAYFKGIKDGLFGYSKSGNRSGIMR